MFQNCINKELLIWEEPLIGPDYVEMCKRVFEGMTTQVPVKFKPAQTLYRTPLLITTNKSLWYYCSGDEAALSNRLVQYTFSKSAHNYALFVSTYASSCYRAFTKYLTKLGQYVSYSKPTSTTSTPADRPEGSSSSGWTSECIYTECELCSSLCGDNCQSSDQCDIW